MALNSDISTYYPKRRVKRIVSIYSGFFRPSSPMWLNWRKDEVFELFGKDYRITGCNGTVKAELDYIC